MSKPRWGHNLSKLDYLWLCEDNYDGDPRHISATSLKKSPKEFAIMYNFREYIPRWAMDNMISLFGTAMHESRERVVYDGLITEKRLVYNIDGVDVSGKFDALDIAKNFPILKIFNPPENVMALNELKTSGMFLAGNHPEKTGDWTHQLNTYRLLIKRVMQMDIYDRAVVTCVMKDYSKSVAIEGSPQWNRNKGLRGHEGMIKYLVVDLSDPDKFEVVVREKLQQFRPLIDNFNLYGYPDCDSKYMSQFGVLTDKKTKKFKGYTKCQVYCGARPFCNQSKCFLGHDEISKLTGGKV